VSERSLVLLCEDVVVDLPAFRLTVEQVAPPARLVPVANLCSRPEQAEEVVRSAAAGHVVVASCRGGAQDLRDACLRGGAEPFGVEVLELEPELPPGRIALLVAGALAKLSALPEDARGKPVIRNRSLSRRALLVPATILAHDPVALIDPGRCVGANRCRLCAEACPSHAIEARNDRPQVRDSRCDACGRCVPACPAGAVQVVGSSTLQLEAQLRVLASSGSAISLACARAPATSDRGWLRLRLPSLAMVSIGWPLQLLAHGAHDVRLEPCDGDCCQAWRNGRRELFDRLRDVLTPPVEPDPQALRLDEPRATASALRVLAPTQDAAFASPHSPLARLECDRASCTLCGACATICPTEAISFDEGGADAVLLCDPGRCVGCGRCVSSCPERSLRVEHGFDLAQLRSGARELQRGDRETLVRQRVEQLLAE
jgi:ferredoxin